MTRLLIVDDDFDLLNTLKDAFVMSGFMVTTASNGQEALAIFRNGQFDIAIFDVELPEMNGFQLTEQVKALRPDLPVVLITGYSHLYRPQDVLSLDVEAFLKKPLNIPEFIQIINNIARRLKGN